MKTDNIQNELYEMTDALLDSQQQVKLRVGGTSMFPFLKHGDIITISKCSISELRIGDVVVFKTDGKWIAHRLLKIILKNNKTFLLTKGDTCRFKDPLFAEEQYAGKVISFERKLKEKKTDASLLSFISIFIARFSVLLSPFFMYNVWFRLKVKNAIASVKNIFFSLKFISKKSKRLTFINIVIAAFQGILPFLIIYLIKWLIDGITTAGANPDKDAAIRSVVVIILITGGVFLISSVLTILSGEFRERLSQSVSLYIYELLQEKHINLDMAYLEDSSSQDKIHRAVNEAGFRPIKMVSESFAALQSMISWIFIAVMLLTIHWTVFLLILFAVIPGILVRIRFAKKLYTLNKASSKKEREAYYYNRILTGLPFAKELRLFGLGILFKSKFNFIQRNLHQQKNKILRKRAVADIAAQTFAVAITFLSFAIVSVMAIRGKLSVGTVVLFFLVFQRGFGVLKEFFQSIAGLYEDNVFLSDFFEFLKLPALTKLPEVPEKLKPLATEINISNVSFQYPSSQRQALNGISIKIPAGKTVALVGPNGSGKTTIVKLLCGFYTANSGKILFDEQDISLVNPQEIRKQITAVFQDFALYNMTAAENIFLGNIADNVSPEHIKQAAANAGIADILEKLPGGYNTMIGNLFEKGEELSIGQWQKLAIARAFYRNSDILFMDEPSSALDAVTELQILQNLKSLAKNKTVLIISHRLSTIKWADIIYVMEQGSVTEQGSHNELMELKGRYYQMFEQSKNN
jgi:ATP-binding cassette subfamily B protein